MTEHFRMKIHVVLIMVISISFSCSTNPPVVRSWFPDDIRYPPAIVEFVNNFSTSDISAARTAYLTILTFIEEMISAHYENIERTYRFDTHTVKRPALINGKLTIIESTDSISYRVVWDDELEELVEIGPSGDFLGEVTQIAYIILLNNNLLDHWFFLTGELLGEHIDIEAVWEPLLKDYILQTFGAVQ